jgi:hypothetical protein
LTSTFQSQHTTMSPDNSLIPIIDFADFGDGSSHVGYFMLQLPHTKPSS